MAEENDTLSIPEEGADALPAGFELKDDNKKYTILNYLSCGAFGYTYRAEMLNCTMVQKRLLLLRNSILEEPLICFEKTRRMQSCLRS